MPGPVRLAAAVLVLALLAGCRGLPTAQWSDVSASPGAQTYQGALAEVLDTRLTSRIDERGLRLLGSRLEALPPGTTWADHLAFRDAGAAGLRRLPERVPEPDAPVIMAEYQGQGRTLFVIARATDDGTRLVVLTALTAPR